MLVGERFPVGRRQLAGLGDGDAEANAPDDDGARTVVTAAAGGLTLETTSTRAAM